jgi:hypothetical protein
MSEREMRAQRYIDKVTRRRERSERRAMRRAQRAGDMLQNVALVLWVAFVVLAFMSWWWV